MSVKARSRVVVAIVAAAGVLLCGAFAHPSTRARLWVIGLKAGGHLETVEWRQVLHLMWPGSPVSDLATSRNPFATIRNPLGPNESVAGKEVFDRQCSKCHGESASGGTGPSLVGQRFKHGDSDWALFLAISRGVDGTAMQPSGLPDDDVWRVVSYLRALDSQSGLGSMDDNENPNSNDRGEPTYATLRGAQGETGDWLLPAGDYAATRFSRAEQINEHNVDQLEVRWVYQFGTRDASIQTSPIVSNGRLYVTLPSGAVTALDAKSGARIWSSTRTLPSDLVLCCASNRGVAVLGNRVYVGTLDAHLLALDATTGKVLWDQTVANYREGYAITSAPLALDGLIVTGIAGGDFPTRGFISAYDSESGALKWRLKTIPEPGEPGNETWGGESWRTGGVSTWMTGSFDPDLNLIYWGTGNPAPDYNSESRPGDNLYSNSVLAIDATTGKLAWFFQFTPGDDHDWDSIQTPILVDGKKGGSSEKLLAVANRNGLFYVLDRQTGRFLRAAPYVRQTWAIGLTPEGRPIRSPNASPSVRGTRLFPGVAGGTNAAKSAYSPLTQLYYVPMLERMGVFFSDDTPPAPRSDTQFLGGSVSPVSDDFFTGIRAIDPTTAKVRWEHRNPLRRAFDGRIGGLLVTAGNLLFGSDRSNFFVLDAQNGAELFSFETGGAINAPPVTYRIDSIQYVVVAAGDVLLSFALKEQPGNKKVVSDYGREHSN
jgi:alcohol dehydrogenase (cytochrome c)